jgi:hypothetical protein
VAVYYFILQDQPSSSPTGTDGQGTENNIVCYYCINYYFKRITPPIRANRSSLMLTRVTGSLFANGSLIPRSLCYLEGLTLLHGLCVILSYITVIATSICHPRLHSFRSCPMPSLPLMRGIRCVNQVGIVAADDTLKGTENIEYFV